ncbi:phage antirepressor [Streptomyces massasporeus]|uniref:phage antirepressor n=1 Tax=Streptomyces massasporeus TaxID=67324 RepID=UPI003658B5B6
MSTTIPDPGQASAYFDVLDRTQPRSAVEQFTYERQAVRVVLIDGEPWFVLGDLCAVLEIANVGNAKKRLDQGNVRQADVPNSAGYMRQTVIVSEAGMYEVVLRSDKPEAVAFRRWITSDVLPQIRRTGSYNAAPALSGEELMAAALLEAQKVLAERDARLAERSKSADAWDRLVEEGHTYKADDAAKILARDPSIGDLGQRRLQQFLAGDREINARKLPRPWLYRANGNGAYRPYQEQIGLGRLELKPGGRYFRGDKTHPKQGEPVVLITAKGLSDLRKFLTNSGQLALL